MAGRFGLMEDLYEVIVFGSEPEFAPRQGVVAIYAQLTKEQADRLVERERAQGRSCRTEAMA
ncbi:hypothetical protein OG786_21115 [Streptomyces sp. NBC_00101]|uniref:hypothetical protein n=1 Tax=Streptomyces sp. NBC_00101 TaxID=2975651 RepID=UPI0032447C72